MFIREKVRSYIVLNANAGQSFPQIHILFTCHID